MTELSDRELLAELGVSIEPEKKAARSPREERIIAGFEEIQRFREEHGRVPQSHEGADIFERLYATRLGCISGDEECRKLVLGYDHQGLLSHDSSQDAIKIPDGDDEALLAELGVETETSDVTKLKHVRSSAEKRAAEDVGNRDKCEDFASFQPLFEGVQRDLEHGVRKTIGFEQKGEIAKGSLFILGGQKAYVAELGDLFTNEHGHNDARLRVIFDNGTESNMLMRSLERALRKDEAGRRISEPSSGPLFDNIAPEEVLSSGTIYVLRTKSENPILAELREVLHKIGVTSGKVERRITNAKNDPTYLLADVEIIAEYKLFDINRTKLEKLIHKVLEPAQLSLVLQDRFGKSVQPREWFLVPLPAVKELVDRIIDGTITQYVFDKDEARLVRISTK